MSLLEKYRTTRFGPSMNLLISRQKALKMSKEDPSYPIPPCVECQGINCLKLISTPKSYIQHLKQFHGQELIEEGY